LESYGDALELTLIALGVLLLISICFVGLTYGLKWLTRFGKAEEAAYVKPGEAAAEELPEAVPAATRPIPKVIGPGVITSPMPGTVISVAVKVGATVQAGDVLLTIESMKIMNEIRAPKDGKVKQIYTVEGAYVRRREPLMEIGE
jgi:biotin carboxyl carrier protein